jgi:hypothetical protein
MNGSITLNKRKKIEGSLSIKLRGTFASLQLVPIPAYLQKVDVVVVLLLGLLTQEGHAVVDLLEGLLLQ